MKEPCSMCVIIAMCYPNGEADTPEAEKVILAHFHHAHYVDVQPYLVTP